MAASEYSTPQAQALRKHTGRLSRAIQESDLPVLAPDFFSEAMISTDLMESVCNPAIDRAVRCSRLLLAVMDHLEDHPDKFGCVLEILRQEPTLCSVAESVERTCGELIIATELHIKLTKCFLFLKEDLKANQSSEPVEDLAVSVGKSILVLLIHSVVDNTMFL